MGKTGKLGMVELTSIPWAAEQEDHHEFEASLGSRVSSKPAM